MTSEKAAAGTAGIEAQIEMAKAAGAANLDALAEASAHAIEGVQACVAEMTAYTRAAMTRNFDLIERLSAVATPQELAAVQIEAGKETVNSAVAQTTKIGRIVGDTAVKASAPLNARANAAMEPYLRPYTA